MLDTPVLFLIFNRPDTTRRVFEAIRLARPRQLFIAADGPRPDRPEDIGKCRQAREIATGVDWDCEVKIFFRDANLGCGKAVSQAITWFFENVEEGIILEDDTLPDQSFFGFCEKLLEKYRYEDKIMHIGGSNTYSSFSSADSYFFSKTATVWGWATWRRAWKLYDFEMQHFQSFLDKNLIASVTTISNQQQIHLANQSNLFKHGIDTWDYQWTFALWFYEGLAIISKTNLVTNIGFGEDATHTKAVMGNAVYHKSTVIEEIQHPARIELNREFDEFIFRSSLDRKGFLATKIKSMINKIRSAPFL